MPDQLVPFQAQITGTVWAQVDKELGEAMEWLPRSAFRDEAKPLEELVRKKRRGAKPIGDLLVPLLVRLGVHEPDEIDSNPSEAQSSR